MQTQRSNATSPRFARHLFLGLNGDFRKALRSIPSYIGRASRFTPLQLTACICVAMLLFGFLPAPARAQTVASCKTTVAPPLYPLIGDKSLAGWSSTTSVAAAKNQFVLGDIDGDGNDELVTLEQGQVQVSRWIGTGWSPMAPFPNAAISANFFAPNGGKVNGSVPVSQVRLADVDGDGQKEIVVFFRWILTDGNDQDNYEQIYHYDKYSTTWTLLVQYQTPLPSTWFKAHTTDVQDLQLVLPDASTRATGYFFIFPQQFVNGSWVAVPGSVNNFNFTSGGSDLSDSQSSCTQTNGLCIFAADVNGDGIADLVYLSDEGRTSIALSTPTSLFGGAVISSKIPAVPTANNLVNSTTTAGWQVGDIDGDGVSELVFPTPDGALHAYYWNTSANDFAAVADPVLLLPFTNNPAGAIVSSFTIAPKPIFATTYTSAGKATTGQNYGLTVIGKSALYFYEFTSSGGKHSFVGYYASFPPSLTSAISVNTGFGPTGYSGFFRFAVEGNNLVMLARSANGIVNLVPSGTGFVDPNTLTDRGYPAYTTSQQAAYQYISGVATQNPDIRSLYPDPAVPWASIQYQVETMAAPPASTGISATDFQFVKKQTIAELTALQSVNLMYAATGQLLTNTYLVKDAALSEITNVLGLSPQPDVASTVLNDLGTAIGGLGAALEGAGVVLTLAKTVSDVLNKAGTLAELLGTVTEDIATYTAPQVPDIATGTYDLKTALDNSSLGALTSNACHQVAALSSWNQSKPLSDGILTGSIPLDLETQQDVLQAAQALFQLDVWQALAPSKWSYVSVQKTLLNGTCGNCLFTGNSSYPLADSVQASGTCSVAGLPALKPDVSLLLEDTSSNNYPNINALNALFNAPPNGVGASPSDVFFGKNNWAIPYAGGANLKFNANTGYTPFSCTGLKLLSPQVTPNIRVGQTASFNSATVGNAGERLETLIAQVKSNLADANLRDHLVVLLGSADSRLHQARQYNNEPRETIRLLNLFIAQSQWHATQDFRDNEISRTQSIEAVAIRDSLIDSMKPAATR
jgi:hypothetical protein